MVLFTASRENTFVGGTCALPSALLVISYFGFKFTTCVQFNAVLFGSSRNVEASCRLPLTTTATSVTNVLLSGAAVWITLGGRTADSTRWRHILAENRDFCLPYLHSMPPLEGSSWKYCHNVWYGKTWMVWLSDVEIWRYLYSFRQNTRTWRTDRHRITAYATRVYSYSIARQKYASPDDDSFCPVQGLLKDKKSSLTKSQSLLIDLLVTPCPWCRAPGCGCVVFFHAIEQIPETLKQYRGCLWDAPNICSLNAIFYSLKSVFREVFCSSSMDKLPLLSSYLDDLHTILIW